jgi:hypothetical protein
LAAELVEQHVVELLPHAGAQLVDEVGQAGAVVDAGPAAVAGWWRRQQRLITRQSRSGTRASVVGPWPRIMPATEPSNKSR